MASSPELGCAPFLVVHGDDDHRVGVDQSRRLYSALVEAGAEAQLLVVPGADHGPAHFDQPPVHEPALEFLRSALKLPRAPERSA